MQPVSFNTLILGYQHHTSPSWFKAIQDDPRFVQGMYYTTEGFNYALVASKNKKQIRDINALNYYLNENKLPLRQQERQQEKTLYIITAQGLNYFKFGITKNLHTRVQVYRSVLKNVQVRFQITGLFDNNTEKKCINFLEMKLKLNRESEKFCYESEEHLEQIIQKLQSFLSFYA